MNKTKTKKSTPSKASSQNKRTSSRQKKSVDYAALQDVKIENDEDSDSIEEITPPPSKKSKKASKSVELVTDGACGECANCQRPPCRECSFCKNGDVSSCIDRYCMNDREGKLQRQAAREAYLLSIGVRKPKGDESADEIHEVYSSDSDDNSSSNKTDQNMRDEIDQVMAKVMADQKQVRDAERKEKEIVKKQEKQKVKDDKQTDSKDKKDKPRTMGIYGGSSKASKSRRCGECEGCMRDDCGQCQACADKPRFGGPGTKKKACVMRFCRMRKLEEDHAQTNYPLSSPEAMNTSNATKKSKTEEDVAVKTEDLDIEDVVLQD